MYPDHAEALHGKPNRIIGCVVVMDAKPLYLDLAEFVAVLVRKVCYNHESPHERSMDTVAFSDLPVREYRERRRRQ